MINSPDQDSFLGCEQDGQPHTEEGCRYLVDVGRRHFLKSVAVAATVAIVPRGVAQTSSTPPAQAAAPQGYVLDATGGEHLIHFRNPGNIFIKLDPTKGSDHLALGTQQVPVGAGIPIHRHFKMDEAFYVLEGGGTFILNDAPHPFEKGGTIFIPMNAWHWVRESRSRIAPALDYDAPRVGRLFPRNLQSARRSAKATDQGASQRDCSQI
jgi:quercetin dioxygenase-like cupin family protein